MKVYLKNYKKGRSIRIRIETWLWEVDQFPENPNKKGRSIRIRIETVQVYVVFDCLFNIKKEDLLE